jgi:hypothetical protein
VRDALANAVINAAKFGERDLAALSAFAIAFGMRNWHLPKRWPLPVNMPGDLVGNISDGGSGLLTSKSACGQVARFNLLDAVPPWWGSPPPSLLTFCWGSFRSSDIKLCIVGATRAVS